MAKKQQIPTELHDYLKYTNKMTAPKARKCQTNDVDLQEIAADCQGIASSATISFNNAEQSPKPPSCGRLHG